MNMVPVGWPCAPFKNRGLVVQFLKAKLIHLGFGPNVQFYGTWPRQIQFAAIQNGQRYSGVVAKFAPRRIKLALSCPPGCSGRTYTFNLRFVA